MRRWIAALTLWLVPKLALAFGFHNTGPDYLTGIVVLAPGFLFLVFLVAIRSGELLKGIVGQVAPWLILVGVGYVLIEWRFKAFIGLSLTGWALFLFLQKARKRGDDKQKMPYIFDLEKDKPNAKGDSPRNPQSTELPIAGPPAPETNPGIGHDVPTQRKPKPWKFNEKRGTLLNRATGKAVKCQWSSLHKVFLVTSGTEGISGWILEDGNRWAAIDPGDVELEQSEP